MPRLRTSVAALAVLSLPGLACTSGREATHSLPDTRHTPATTSPSPPAASPAPAAPRRRVVAASLRPFADCGSLVSALRAEALQEVTPWGLGTGYGTDVMPVGAGVAASGTAGAGTSGALAMPAPAAASDAAARSPEGFSTTNNQEAGVDEPDTVKTNGAVMVVVRQNPPTLVVLDVSGDRPRQVGKLPVSLGSGQLQLLMAKDKVVVLGQRYSGRTSTVVAEVYTVAEPAAPRHLRTFQVTGAMLDARFVSGRILLVTHSAPRIAFPAYPYGVAPADAQRTALSANKALIRRTTAADWLPSVQVTPHRREFRAACDQASRPGVASGTGATSIVTLDPDADEPTSNRTVVGSGDILYASSRQLFLATNSWRSQGVLGRGLVDGVVTDLHAFDITAPDDPRYLASGSLPGRLVDRYALSEQDGYLRVATTVGSPLPPVGEGARPRVLSDNRVTVLKPVDGVLTKVGEVRGLGRGQQIFGVRFLGDIGYVVTFRSIDPLYALDLSDPKHPRTRGELHISGFSSALYPLSSGRLLGVGQAVGSHQQQLGAQAEVFDVSSLERPRLTGKKVWANAYSSAASDHHALLWWQPRGLVVMPLQGRTLSLVVLRVSASGTLTEVGRVRQPQDGGGDAGSSGGGAVEPCCYGSYGSLQRAVVVGDLLYSIADNGLVTNPLDEVTAQRWLPFR